MPVDPKVAWARITNRARASVGLNQAQFAELLGVTPRAVHNWERGLRLPREEHRRRLTMLVDEAEDEENGKAA